MSNIINRIKKFFTEKPKGNVWKRAFIYLFFLRYVGFLALIFMFPLLTGMLSPGQDMDFSSTGEELAISFTDLLQKMYDIGSNIGESQPIMSKALVFLLSNFIWIIYFGIIVLCIDILRYLIHYILEKFAKKDNQDNSPQTKHEKGLIRSESLKAKGGISSAKTGDCTIKDINEVEQ